MPFYVVGQLGDQRLSIAAGETGLDIRVGKMATLVGYEVIESQLDNQYSRSILFTKLQNFTQTGVRAALSIGDKLTATAGFSIWSRKGSTRRSFSRRWGSLPF